MTRKYEETPERLILASGFMEPPAEATSKRIRARSECASSRAQFAWMRFDVCTTRGGGTLPGDVSSITSSKSVDRMFRAFLGTAHLELQEVFAVIAVDSKNAPLGFAVVNQGGVASTAVDPHMVFKPAVLLPAPAIVVCHNHPSGELAPSGADIDMTQRLVDGGAVLGIRVLDHLILTRDSYYSFLDNGRMPVSRW